MLYDHRLKAVHEDGKEKQKYGQLCLHYMSEESDEANIIVHRPEWRSDGNVVSILWNIQVLNRFLQELDRRLLDTQKESKKHIPDHKQRILGAPMRILQSGQFR